MHVNPRLSIVDDDDLIRKALRRLCKMAGYVVASFSSAEEFLEAGSSDETDCLILDVHLPGRSGLQLQRKLQASGKVFPIVFVTAFEDEQARSQALETGAVAFLHKPLDNDLLLRVIRQAVDV